MIGWVPTLISKPALVISSLKKLVLFSNLSRRTVDEESISNAFSPAATIDGASVLEKRYGRDLCLNRSIIYCFTVVNPPDAPPNALPRVDVQISTLSITPPNSADPRPVFPMNPVACESSTITMALYC